MIDFLLHILIMMVVVGTGFLSIITWVLAWKVLRCPDSLWEELRRTPYNKSYSVIQRILK